MDFKISLIEGHPVWDALPVGKIIYYPLENGITALLRRLVCVPIKPIFFCACGRLKPIHPPKVC